MRALDFARIIARLGATFIFLVSVVSHHASAQTTVKAQIRTTAESPVIFDLTKQSGKTVLVFHWRTNCPVCLDKLEELRSNIAGWKIKPFVVLAINHDRNRQDFQSYLQISRTLNGDIPQLIHVYNKDIAQDSLYKGAALPTSYLIDDKQMLRQTYVGRIPAEAWNDIADLLP
jgi:peroxiredoxin